jgi:hypothetical protein
MSKSDKDSKDGFKDVDLNSSDSDWVDVNKPDDSEWVNVEKPKEETYKPKSSITVSYAQAAKKDEKFQGK